MQRLRPYLNASVLLALGITAITLVWFRFDRSSTYNFDPQNKLYQLDSLSKQGFRSEALLYPGEDLDPEHRYDPIPYSLRLPDGRHVSAFPVALSVVAAPIYQLFGAQALSLVSLLSLIGTWLLYARSRPPLPLLAGLMGSTFLWLLILDFNEYLIPAVLGAAGLRLLLGALPSTDSERPTLHLPEPSPGPSKAIVIRALSAGIVSGGIVWFRHEGLVYCGALFLATLALLIGRRRAHDATENDRRHLLAVILAFAIGSGLLVGSWALWNFVDYGHVLGPRYLVNQGGVLPGPIEILRRYQHLLFFGGAKAGLFLLLPFLPVLLLRSLRGFFGGRSPGPQEHVLSLSTAIFVFFIPAMVPNDGIGVGSLGPRFLIPAVVPAFLLTQLWYHGGKPWQRRLLLGWLIVSAIPPIFMFSLHRKAASYQRGMHDRYAADPVDIRIFSTISFYYYYGADTTNCECYLAEDDERLADLLKRLQRHRPGRTVALIHRHQDTALRENAFSKNDPALRAEMERLLRTSRWDLSGIEKSPALSEQKQNAFKDAEIWTARLAGLRSH